MTQSQPAPELILNLQTRIAKLEQDNQQLQAELTELWQEHERLQQSQARYRQLFENAPISMLFINTEGYITEMNRASEHLFGTTIEQLNKQASPIFANAQLVENGTLPYMLQALAGETVIEEPTYYDTSQDIDGGKLNYGKGYYFPIRDKAEVVREIVEIAPDFSDLWATQQKLQSERDRAATERLKLLGTIAQVANLLLKSFDYTTVLFDVVRLLGLAVGSDRCSITQDTIHPTSGKLAVKVVAWWDKPGIVTTTELIPEYEEGFILEAGSFEFHEPFLRGEVANFLVADLPEPMRSVFAAQGNTSMLIVPIMVQGQCWGEIGFDNCEESRLYDETEIALLKIAADSVAAALERQAKDDELRRSEALYRSLFEISNEGIYRYELDQPVLTNLPIEEQIELTYQRCYYTQANNAFAEMYGLANDEDIVGMRLDAHEANPEKNQAFLRAVIENGYRIRNAESEEFDANRHKHYFLNSIICLIENDHVTGGWGTQIDITELRQAQHALLQAEQDRTELLKTVTTVANQLLRSTDYTTVIADVLQILGEAANADRCGLVQNVTDPQSGKSAIQMHTEWCRADIQASIVHTPELESALLWEYFPDFNEKLAQGEVVHFFVNEISEPARQLLLEQGNIAMTMVPIIVQGQFWGIFGFDYCRESYPYDQANTPIFAIAVDSIAAAIDRQQKEQALLQAEQARAAELTKINDALRQTLNILATESDINRFLGHLLKVIADQFNSPVIEYWLHPEGEHAYLGLSYYQGRVLTPEEQPGHPGRLGYIVLPEMIHQEHLDVRQHHFIVEDLRTDTMHRAISAEIGIDIGAWCSAQGVSKLLKIPLRLGKAAIGALLIFVPSERTLSEQQIELAYALAHQVTLAIRLTQLAEEAKEAAIARAQEKAAHDRAAQLARANQVLQRTVAQLVGQDDLNQFLTYVLLEAAQEAEAANAAIFLYDSPSDMLKMHQAVQDRQVVNLDTDPRFALWKTPVPASSTPFWKQMIQSFTIWIAFNQDQGDAWDFSIPWHLQMGHQSVLCVPLLLGHEPLGFLGLCFRNPLQPGAEPIELVQTLAHQATLALQLTRLAEEAKQAAIIQEQEKAAQARVAELAKVNDALIQTLNLLAANPDLDQFLGQVLMIVNRQMRVPASTLWQWDTTGSACLQMTCLGDQVLTELEQWRGFPSKSYYLYDNPIMQEVWRTRCPATTSDLKNPAIIYPEHYGWMESLNIKSLLVVPLLQGDTIIGTLNIHQAECDRTRLEEIELAQALAHQVTLAIQLSRLAEQVKQTAVLEERNRLAREIHDTLAQALTGIVVHLESTEHILMSQPETARQRLDLARQLARETLIEARQSVKALRPQALVSEQLPAAIATLIERLPQDTSPSAEFSLHGSPCSLPSALETNLLRIAQEALANVVKHAQASRVQVNLMYEVDEICLSVQDNGQGFDLGSITQKSTSDSACFGLLIMQERAEMIEGQLTIRSYIGQGTTVRVTIPRCTI